MKIAVIGGGTAGFMAAAHITHFFPDFEFFHIFDPGMPTIGVGEGTLPFFARWIHGITDLAYEDLARICLATCKYGVQFEGWGKTHPQFYHLFGSTQHAYHLSAQKLTELLVDYVQGTRLNKHVHKIRKTGGKAHLDFNDGSALQVDFVFDARGFPKEMGKGHITFPEIPTNAALLQRGPVISHRGLTRAAARPHGWIFVIPLADYTSYGYIYNHDVSNQQQVQLDFEEFLQKEGVNPKGEMRNLKFPSFMRASIFDGVIFHLGNCASFLEPLEATAIGMILEQLRIASYWLAGAYLNDPTEAEKDPAVIDAINQKLRETVRAVSLFVSWHYACGSIFETKFWQHARACFIETCQELTDSDIMLKFDAYLAAGGRYSPDSVPKLKSEQVDNEDRISLPELNGEFGGFSALSFAQIGHGTGYYQVKS